MRKNLPVYRRRNCAPEMWPDQENKENDLQNQTRPWLCSGKHFVSILLHLNRRGRWHPRTFLWKIVLTLFGGDVAAGDSGGLAVRTKALPPSFSCLSRCGFLVLKSVESSRTYISQHNTGTESESASLCFLLLAMGTSSSQPVGGMGEPWRRARIWSILIPEINCCLS